MMALAVESAAFVLTTKLGPPRLRADTVARHRLAARLRAGLVRPLTIVCAPGGFGKTTGARRAETRKARLRARIG